LNKAISDTKNSTLICGTIVFAWFSCYGMHRSDANRVKKTKNAGVGFQVSGAGVSTGSGSDWVPLPAHDTSLKSEYEKRFVTNRSGAKCVFARVLRW
jgi:hypothetical protein